MNSPIKYFGGKNLIYNNILKYFPLPESYNTYIEPFGGSFGIGLKKPICINEIYNDLEQNVYSLFKVLSDEQLFNQFKKLCDLAYYNADLRIECRNKLKTNNLNIVERAFCFFYVNRTSFNGIGGIQINLSVRRAMSRSVSDLLQTIDNLYNFHQRFSKVIVLNMDGIELIKKYNAPNVLIYCDPPYEHSTRGSYRYKVDMTLQQHIDFINVCIQSKSKILISGYDCEIYKVLEDNGFQKFQFNKNTVDTNSIPKIVVETLWKNFENNNLSIF